MFPIIFNLYNITVQVWDHPKFKPSCDLWCLAYFLFRPSHLLYWCRWLHHINLRRWNVAKKPENKLTNIKKHIRSTELWFYLGLTEKLYRGNSSESIRKCRKKLDLSILPISKRSVSVPQICSTLSKRTPRCV